MGFKNMSLRVLCFVPTLVLLIPMLIYGFSPFSLIHFISLILMFVGSLILAFQKFFGGFIGIIPSVYFIIIELFFEPSYLNPIPLLLGLIICYMLLTYIVYKKNKLV